MKKVFVGVICMVSILFGIGNVSALDSLGRVTAIQANPTGLPSVPSGNEAKGFVGSLIADMFWTSGKIKTAFLSTFQDIDTTAYNNTLPRWIKISATGEGKFTAGTIRDDGTNIGIGTGVLTNRRVNVLGDINFSGEIYKNGVLFNPTLPTDVVRTFGDQNIGGIKTFLQNPKIQNISPTSYYLDTNNRSAMVHVNNNNLYILRGAGTGSTLWTAYNGRWPLQINLENNNAFFGGAGDFLGDIYSKGTAYYGDGKNAIQFSDTWLRLNTRNDFGSGTYTPGLFRTDGVFQVGGNGDRFTVLANGNVGIGTKTPAYQLDIKNSVNIGGSLFHKGNPIINTDGAINSTYNVNTTRYGGYQVRNSSGSVGGWFGFGDVAAGRLDLTMTGSVNKLVITGGDVGIGTTVPTQKLDVNGKIRMRTQTVSGDTADTVTTKGYVDSKTGFGWVKVDSYNSNITQMTQGIGWNTGIESTPENICKSAGYTTFLGACRAQSGALKIQGTVVANNNANYWKLSCNYGQDSYYMNPTGEILCVK